MIKMIDVYKSFGKNEVLKGINLHVERGEVVVIIGPSGSGKSTFLRCLNRLEKITSGHVVVDGIPYPTLTPTSTKCVKTSEWCSSISTCSPILR